jgi:hypothetical protein
MRITWNPDFKQFEAQLSAGEHWSGDQQAVKAAGFRTEGPPCWRWIAFRAAVLTKLRESKPASGIVITPEALEHYKRLLAQEDRNAEVRKALKEARKAAEKDKQESGPEIDWDHVEPGESKIRIQYVPPPPPSLLCSVCQTPVYYYESQDPPICLDCEFEEF